MGTIKVGIALDDVEFAYALSRSLAAECKDMILSLITERGDEDPFDLLLTDRRMDDPRAIVLVKDRLQENICGNPPYGVYRYKESRHLADDLLFIFFRLTGRNYEMKGEKRCKVLAFSAVSGGCGCTALALSVGQMLYKLYGQKCLYLNLCPVNDSRKYLQVREERNFLTLLYYLDENVDFPLGEFITHAHNIDCIHAAVFHTHYDEMEPHLLNLLLKKVEQSGEYTYFIADISNHLSRTNRSLLQKADFQILLSHWQNLLPRTFFSEVREEIKRLVPGPTMEVMMVSEEMETENTEIFPITWGKGGSDVSDEKAIDLYAMDFFQAQAGAIAKRITEEGETC